MTRPREGFITKALNFPEVFEVRLPYLALQGETRELALADNLNQTGGLQFFPIT